MTNLVSGAVTKAENHVAVVIEFDIRQPRLIRTDRKEVSNRIVELREVVPDIRPRLPATSK